MDIREHWEAGESYAAASHDVNAAEEERHLDAHIAAMHFQAVAAAALFRQHYPAAYAEAIAAGPDAAREVAENWPGADFISLRNASPDARRAHIDRYRHPGSVVCDDCYTANPPQYVRFPTICPHRTAAAAGPGGGLPGGPT